MHLRFEISGELVELDVRHLNDMVEVAIGPDLHLAVWTDNAGVSHIPAGGDVPAEMAVAARTDRGIEVFHAGRVYVFTPAAARRGTAAGHTGAVAAPMVGVLADLLVVNGDRVTAGQPLAVVEAMKVMATLEAPFDGEIAGLALAKGDRVAHGETILTVNRIETNGDARE